MILRWIKILLVCAVGVNLSLTALDNFIFDYQSNYQFVQHVLAMDTLFSGDANAWRSLRAPAGSESSYWVYRFFYATLIAWEAATAACCLIGGLQMWRAVKASPTHFDRAKHWALIGLGISLLQWFFAFETVGGAWFQMWQSSTWNGLSAAARMFLYVSVIFLVVKQHDAEMPTS